jgi:hypothetical protein
MQLRTPEKMLHLSESLKVTGTMALYPRQPQPYSWVLACLHCLYPASGTGSACDVLCGVVCVLQGHSHELGLTAQPEGAAAQGQLRYVRRPSRVARKGRLVWQC